MTDAYLAEVSEAEAEGHVAELYGQIRQTIGLPVVNLVYRHLAVDPARLDAVWGELRPNLASVAAASAARGLVGAAARPGVEPLSARALAAIGVDGGRLSLARATVDVYARANSRNLLGMNALLDGCAGRGDDREADGEAEAAPAGASILPMADVKALPPAVLALLDEMSSTLVGAEEPRVVPSLLRHFADDAPLLAVIWTAMRPAAADLEIRRLEVAEEGRLLAGRLPYPVSQLEDPALRRTAGRFVVAMSAMLVAGEAIRAALG